MCGAVGELLLQFSAQAGACMFTACSPMTFPPSPSLSFSMQCPLDAEAMSYRRLQLNQRRNVFSVGFQWCGSMQERDTARKGRNMQKPEAAPESQKEVCISISY